MVDLSMRLSEHFTLADMVRTSHRTVDNTPSPEVVENLKALCVALLEPIWEKWGPLWVTSGYRCEELNTLIRGSMTSSHLWGRAADFVPMLGMPTEEVVEWIMDSGMMYDQVIDEHSSTSNWIHLGMAKPGREPRRSALIMRSSKYFLFERQKDES